MDVGGPLVAFESDGLYIEANKTKDKEQACGEADKAMTKFVVRCGDGLVENQSDEGEGRKEAIEAHPALRGVRAIV